MGLRWETSRRVGRSWLLPALSESRGPGSVLQLLNSVRTHWPMRVLFLSYPPPKNQLSPPLSNPSVTIARGHVGTGTFLIIYRNPEYHKFLLACAEGKKKYPPFSHLSESSLRTLPFVNSGSRLSGLGFEHYHHFQNLSENSV